MDNYANVRANSFTELDDKVEIQLQLGFIPIGSVVIFKNKEDRFDDLYIQTMYKPKC